MGWKSPGALVPTPLWLDLSRPPLKECKVAPEQHASQEVSRRHHGGVVYVTLGTFGYMEKGPFEELVAGLDNWTKLGVKRGVVMALNEFGRTKMNATNIPSSIRVESWVNQKMVLHHKSTVSFITHAGLGSFSESIDALTPMMALQLFGDRMDNAFRLEEAGAALALHW